MRNKQKKKLDQKHAKINYRVANERDGDGASGGGGVAASDNGAQRGGEETREEAEAASSSSNSEKDKEEAEEEAEEEIEVERFNSGLAWFHTFNAKTKLDRAHYRTIHAVTCDTHLTDLSPSPSPSQNSQNSNSKKASNLALRVTIRGESFMYHQIRHMIGLMIAAYVVQSPLSPLGPSLSAPLFHSL